MLTGAAAAAIGVGGTVTVVNLPDKSQALRVVFFWRAQVGAIPLAAQICLIRVAPSVGECV